VTEVDLRPLRLDRLSDARVVNNPYPRVVVENALDHLDLLNADFPPREQFGPTIRMDGDLTSGDPAYENLISQSPAYCALHRQVYSPEFVMAFLELFRGPIERAHRNNELLADPFKLRTVSEPVERRISGQSFVGAATPFSTRDSTSAIAPRATGSTTGAGAFTSTILRA
jgi:hypothetical protein